MSVEQYGARLLDEVQEQGLDELLKDLRATISPTPEGILGLPQVDKLFDLFRYHQRHTPPRRPGWTTLSYPGSRAGSDDEPDDYEADPDDFESRRTTQLKYRPPVLEVTSTKSAAGKTSLLYQLAALALLPHDHGGQESAVLWLDTDNNFSASRLAQTSTYVLSKFGSNSASAIDDIVNTSFQHLYILKPTSSTSLANALKSVPSHLLRHTSHTSPNRPLSLVVLDSATAFSYQDRFDADIARLEAGPGADTSRSSTLSRTSQIITALRQIQHDFECAIIFTTAQQPNTRSKYKTRPNPLKRPAPSEHPSIPSEAPSQSPWTSFATLTLKMSRISVAQFAPNMTLDECLRDREKRQEAVAKGRFAVGLDWEGSGMWPAGVRDIVNGMEGRGGFVARISEKGVDVE